MKRLLVPALYTALALTVLFSVRSVIRDFREIAQWGADTTRTFDSVEVHRLINDTVQALEVKHQAERDSLLGLANRRAVARWNAQREGDSLRGVLQESHSASDSAEVALRLAERYQVALGEALAESSALRAIIASQQMSLARLTVDNETAWADIDSLQALIRRVPGKCKVLGVPCPTLVAGYGVTAQGLGPFAGIAIPLR